MGQGVKQAECGVRGHWSETTFDGSLKVQRDVLIMPECKLCVRDRSGGCLIVSEPGKMIQDDPDKLGSGTVEALFAIR